MGNWLNAVPEACQSRKSPASNPRFSGRPSAALGTTASAKANGSTVAARKIARENFMARVWDETFTRPAELLGCLGGSSGKYPTCNAQRRVSGEPTGGGRLPVAYYGSSDPHTPREKCEKSLVPESVITEFVLGVAHVAELADALDSGSSE